jgi:hypothetical protein
MRLFSSRFDKCLTWPGSFESGLSTLAESALEWAPTSIRLIHSGVHADTMTSIGVGKNPAAGLFCCGQFDSTAMTGISALSIT